MSGFDEVVWHAILELDDGGYYINKDVLVRKTRLSDREVSRALTSLKRRGMIVARRWGAPPGTFVPIKRGDADAVPPTEM
jgi:hypothetical protein